MVVCVVIIEQAIHVISSFFQVANEISSDSLDTCVSEVDVVALKSVVEMHPNEI